MELVRLGVQQRRVVGAALLLVVAGVLAMRTLGRVVRGKPRES